MFTEIQGQASKLWKTLSDPKTLETYQHTLGLTWTILQEAARLLWLMLCLGIVWLAWGWAASLWAGRNVRAFVSEVSQPDAQPMTNQLGQVLLTAGQQSFSIALNTAKDQLGIKDSPKFMQALAPAETPAETNVSKPQETTSKTPAPKVEPAVKAATETSSPSTTTDKE